MISHGIREVRLVYGQSMGGKMGMELIHQLEKTGIPVYVGFFDGGPFLTFPKFVSRILGNKFKTIIGNLRGKTLEEALREPTIVKFSGNKPERYASLLGPICQNAPYISDETLEKEAEACTTFNYPEVNAKLTFFYSKEESAYLFAHKKVEKAYPGARFILVKGYGHVGFVSEHTEEYTGYLKQAAR